MGINSSIDLSALSAYTDQLSQALVKESVLFDDTVNMVSLVTGVKYKEALNIMNSTLVAQAGGCGTINATGSVALLQRDIQVCPLKIEEAICLENFDQYWEGQFAKAGSQNEAMAANFNAIYTADKVAKIQGLVADYFWSGSTTGTYSTTLTLCNGILAQLELTSASASIVRPGATYSGFTSVNAIDLVKTLIAGIPTDIIANTNLKLFMSHSNYNVLIFALQAVNNYHFTGDQGNFKFMFPGTNVEVVATRGLRFKNKMVLTPADNLVFGTDLKSDWEQFKVWFENKDDQVYFRAKWKQGAQVYFPQYVVFYAG